MSERTPGSAEPSPGPPWRRVPPKVLLRFGILMVILASGFAAARWGPLGEYLDRERIVVLLDQLRAAWWSPLALLGMYLVLCPIGVPATPMIFAGGAVFGVLWGGVYNSIGCILGAAVSYFIGLGLGREMVVHVVGVERIERVERVLQKHGFWNLVRVRFLPIPFPLVNYGSALAGVDARTFLVTSTLGLVPAILIYTWFIASVMGAAAGPSREHYVQLAMALGLSIFMASLPSLFKWVQKRRRARVQQAAEARERTSG